MVRQVNGEALLQPALFAFESQAEAEVAQVFLTGRDSTAL